MKRLLLFAFSLCLLLLAACQSGDAPLLTVKSEDSTVTPYALKRSYRSWDEERGQWISGSFAPMNVTTYRREFPTLVCADRLSFDCEKSVTVQSVTVYSSNSSEIASFDNTIDFDSLPAGELYALIRVTRQGDYIEQGQGYEESGYDLGFRLAKLPVETDEPLCQITCGGTSITPYDHHLASFDGQRFADSNDLAYTLEGSYDELPVLVWTETPELHVNPNAHKRGFNVYDRNGKHLDYFSDISALDSLPGGEYLVVAKVVEYHEYLPDIDEFAYTVYEAGFRLIKNPTHTDESLCRITSGANTVSPYEHFVSSFEWTEKGWLCADASPLNWCLEEHLSELPTLIFDGTISHAHAPCVEGESFDVYDMEGQEVRSNITRGLFSYDLPPGEYIVIHSVTRYDRYIAEQDQWERSGWDLGFRLIKP